MMPVGTEGSSAMTDNHQDETIDYKKKYKVLKRKVKVLLCENECFLEELRKAQRKLLRVSRDKNFLLDRLLQYEPTDDTSDDSEATQTSDSETEAGKEQHTPKKKKIGGHLGFGSPIDPSLILGNLTSPSAGLQHASANHSPGNVEPAKKKVKAKKNIKPASAKLVKTSPGNVGSAALLQGMKQMTREELEQHLEFKQNTKPQFMSIEKAPNSLPDDIFSNDNSNPDGDSHSVNPMVKEEDDADLVIDVPRG